GIRQCLPSLVNTARVKRPIAAFSGRTSSDFTSSCLDRVASTMVTVAGRPPAGSFGDGAAIKRRPETSIRLIGPTDSPTTMVDRTRPEVTLKQTTAPVAAADTKPTLPLAAMSGCANSSRTIADDSATVLRSPSLARRSLAWTTIKLRISRHAIMVATLRLSVTLRFLPGANRLNLTTRAGLRLGKSYAFGSRTARESSAARFAPEQPPDRRLL